VRGGVDWGVGVTYVIYADYVDGPDDAHSFLKYLAELGSNCVRSFAECPVCNQQLWLVLVMVDTDDSVHGLVGRPYSLGQGGWCVVDVSQRPQGHSWYYNHETYMVINECLGCGAVLSI